MHFIYFQGLVKQSIKVSEILTATWNFYNHLISILSKIRQTASEKLIFSRPKSKGQDILEKPGMGSLA